MEKFIVMVNHKYLVSVEAESNGGAEHKCLDLIHGIEYAQAFNRNDIRTEFFRDNAFYCETISFSELKEKTEAIGKRLEYEKDCNIAISENEHRLKKLRNEIELLESNNDILRQNILSSEAERKSLI